MTAWKKTFISAFLAQILSVIGFSFAMPFLPFFIGELGVENEAQQAWWAGVAMAAAGVTLGLFAPLWGILADRYGRKLMVVRAMFGGTIVLGLMSMVQSVEQLIACRLLQGIFTGTIAASVALVASVTPERRSGFALGMMQAAVLMGVSLGPLAGGLVADHFGYRAAFRAGALIILFGGLLVYYGAREEFTPADPDDENAPPGFRSILATSGFLVAVLILFSVRFSNTMANPSFPLIVKDILPSTDNLNSITGSAVATAAIGGAVAAGVLGHVGDSWGHKRILIGCSLGAAVASTSHAFAYSMPALYAARLFFGLSVAGMLPAANALIRSISDNRSIGKAYGAATALSMAGIALGPLVGGYLVGTAGLRTPFVATGVAQLLVAVIVVFAVRGDGPVGTRS